MTERSVGSKRLRRTARVTQQLAKARERNNQQLAQMREREVLVERALRDYVGAAEQVAAVEQVCQEKVAQWEARIGQIRRESDERLADIRSAQARAALAIHLAGRTVKQVADLFELTEKTARELIRQGRELAARPGSSGAAGKAATGASGYRERGAEYLPTDLGEARRYATSMATPTRTASTTATDAMVSD